jgi:putative endonuclease
MSRAKGNIAEAKAASFLLDQNFKIVEQNYYAKKLGEIDIIAFKDDVYHFVEVKSGENFEAIYNITPSKILKLIKSIEYYLKVKNLDVSYCIDAIIISNDDIDFIENITL